MAAAGMVVAVAGVAAAVMAVSTELAGTAAAAGTLAAAGTSDTAAAGTKAAAGVAAAEAGAPGVVGGVSVCVCAFMLRRKRARGWARRRAHAWGNEGLNRATHLWSPRPSDARPSSRWRGESHVTHWQGGGTQLHNWGAISVHGGNV